ncbi:hypothetical protein M2322_001769 [Rhodoblastus acidophilus]|uniref:hypothetical protein n=1 Tax=Rhodoblastus acidophilus TaxID=1074 RepID=UPI00222531BA|nr:hypothetical protein [Rhodoblastus acidophilus]MCW2316225.1 hypothetical protein [Rhodoblastus acidophilus]
MRARRQPFAYIQQLPLFLLARDGSACLLDNIFQCLFLGRAPQQFRFLRLLLDQQLTLDPLRTHEMAAGEAQNERIVVRRVAQHFQQLLLLRLGRGLAAPDLLEFRLIHLLQLIFHAQQAFKRAMSFAHQFPFTAQSAKSAMKAVIMVLAMK